MEQKGTTMYTHPRSVILLGPPGSGKGTQAARLSCALEVPSISTGEILRRECQSGTELGKRIDSAMRSGKLVSNEQMNQIAEARLLKRDCKGGCILDGFPRTVQQASYLETIMKRIGIAQPIAFNFLVSTEDLIERLRLRRQCPTCARIYCADSFSLGTPLICQNDHSLLVSRADDQPDAIRERMRLYERNAADLLAHYRRHRCHDIQASKSPDEVTAEIFECLGLGCIAPRRLPEVTRCSVAVC